MIFTEMQLKTQKLEPKANEFKNHEYRKTISSDLWNLRKSYTSIFQAQVEISSTKFAVLVSKKAPMQYHIGANWIDNLMECCALLPL